MRLKSLLVLGGLAILFTTSHLPAQSTPTETKPQAVAPASNEGEVAMERFRVPPGFKVELFAAEPLLANPVAFCIDERGRFYVAETVVVVTTDGLAHTGVLKNEDDRQLTLITSEAKLITIPKDHVEERARGPSSMPDTLVKYLTKSELRDVVEFLAERK